MNACLASATVVFLCAAANAVGIQHNRPSRADFRHNSTQLIATENILPGNLRYAKEVTYSAGRGGSARIAIRPEWGVLTLEVEMKVDGVERGKENWQTARVPMEFKDAAGKHSIHGRTWSARSAPSAGASTAATSRFPPVRRAWISDSPRWAAAAR